MNKEQKKEINEKVTVVATGGLSEIVANESDVIDVVDKTLTLRGLNVLYKLNSDKK
jgi:type III pantothenate kinase